MYPDVTELRRFYTTPLGRAARDGIEAALSRLMAEDARDGHNGLSGEGVIGFGYATPFLRKQPARGDAASISAQALDFALMPAPQGVMYWPRRRPARSALVEETALPLTNGFAERLLVVHALEHAAHVEDVLRELWRVLAPGGRIIIAVPHRRTMWSSRDISPFAHGRPYSRAQLRRLLVDTEFVPLREEGALFGPPGRSAAMVRLLRSVERPGRLLWPGFPGVILVEAEKRVFAPVGKRRRVRERARAPAWAPARQPGISGLAPNPGSRSRG